MEIAVEKEKRLMKKIRWITVLFIVLLVLSGVTAIPLEQELEFIQSWFNPDSLMGAWLEESFEAISAVNAAYPSMAYGTDWLAFAHVVIAIAFIGPLRDPVRNKWIYQFGLIACGLVIPVALIAGPLREIPFFWQLIDCSFGIIGCIPLWLCLRWTNNIEKFRST